MGFFGELLIGLKSYNKALKFTSSHKLWGYYIVPALINLVIVFVIAWAMYHYTSDLSYFLENILGIGEKEGWWVELLDKVLIILLYIIIILFFIKIYKYIILTLLSPVLSLLAEKTQVKLTGVAEPPFQLKRLLKDVARGISVALRSLVIEMGLTIILLLLSLTGFLAPITSVLLIVVECYFLGFSMMDYHYEFKQIPAKESVKLVRKHKGLSIGTGLGLYLIFFIPLVGITFGPMLAVVSAGLGIDQIDQKQLKSANLN